MSDNERINPELDFSKGVKVPESDHKSFPFKPEVKEPRIFIEQDVYDTMQAHAAESTNVELCGVLVGKMYADESGNFLHIVGSIRGEYARNKGTNVSFTPETWDYINEQREQKYPDYKVIGWYHTHPGFTVFFSGMDKFIQDYFFNEPYYIAVVIDPKIDSTGCFAWIDGKLKGLTKWWVGDKEVELTVGPVGNDLSEQDIDNAQDTDPEEKISEEFIEIYKEYKKSGKEALSNIKDILNANGGAPIVIGFVMFILGFLVSQFYYSSKVQEAYSRTFKVENREAVTNLIDDMRTQEDFRKIGDLAHSFSHNLLYNCYISKLSGEDRARVEKGEIEITEYELSRINYNDLQSCSITADKFIQCMQRIESESSDLEKAARNRKDSIVAFLSKHQTYPGRIQQSDDDIQFMKKVIGDNLREEALKYVKLMKIGKTNNLDQYEQVLDLAKYIKSLGVNDREFNERFIELNNTVLKLREEERLAEEKEAEANANAEANTEGDSLLGKGEPENQTKSEEQPSEQPKVEESQAKPEN